MTVWIVQPHDALIVRDGRPFGPTPGARARSMAFPFPSTIAGSVRALWWVHGGRTFSGQGVTSQEQHELLNVAVKGPLLVELEDSKDAHASWLLPAPADVLLLRTNAANQDTVELHRLLPLAMPVGAITNLEAEADDQEQALWLVGLERPNPNKPEAEIPLYWHWKHLQTWLLDPQQLQQTFASQSLSALGSKGPTSESRTHLRVRPGQLTAQEGFLFQTSGLEFHRLTAPRPGSKATLTQVKHFALGVITDVELPTGPAFLGGERRAVQWQKTNLTLPTCPSEIRNTIVAQKHCRLMLLTPGQFAVGDRPSWLLTSTPGVTATVRGMVVQRPQIVSGWDYAEKRPKATQRLAPAGSVYFLKLDGDEKAIEQFVDQLWMTCVSDGEQERRDGFGLAVLGTWDGLPRPMTKEDNA